MSNLRKFVTAALATSVLTLCLTGCEKDPAAEATPEVITGLAEQAFSLMQQEEKCFTSHDRLPSVTVNSKWPAVFQAYKTDKPNASGLPYDFFWDTSSVVVMKALADAGYLDMTVTEAPSTSARNRIVGTVTFAKNAKSDEAWTSSGDDIPFVRPVYTVCTGKTSFAGVDYDTKTIKPTYGNDKVFAMDIKVKYKIDPMPYVTPDSKVFGKYYEYLNKNKELTSSATVIFDSRLDEPKWELEPRKNKDDFFDF